MVKLWSPKSLRCSFCGKDETKVAKLVGGPGVQICDTCIGQCNDVLAGRPTPGFPGWEALSDADLLAQLPGSESWVEAARGALQAQVEVLRKRGVSWEAIGRALGITRQAAWERFS